MKIFIFWFKFHCDLFLISISQYWSRSECQKHLYSTYLVRGPKFIAPHKSCLIERGQSWHPFINLLNTQCCVRRPKLNFWRSGRDNAWAPNRYKTLSEPMMVLFTDALMGLSGLISWWYFCHDILFILTHWGLVMLYSIINLDCHYRFRCPPH